MSNVAEVMDLIRDDAYVGYIVGDLKGDDGLVQALVGVDNNWIEESGFDTTTVEATFKTDTTVWCIWLATEDGETLFDACIEKPVDIEYAEQIADAMMQRNVDKLNELTEFMLKVGQCC